MSGHFLARTASGFTLIFVVGGRQMQCNAFAPRYGLSPSPRVAREIMLIGAQVLHDLAV